MSREKITVERPGNPQLYQPVAISGWDIVGTVTRPDGKGALARNQRTGIYAQFNAGAIRSLDQRAVAIALGTLGRPTELTGGKRVNVYLDGQSLATAERIGGGNVSAGIREALGRVSSE